MVVLFNIRCGVVPEEGRLRFPLRENHIAAETRYMASTSKSYLIRVEAVWPKGLVFVGSLWYYLFSKVWRRSRKIHDKLGNKSENSGRVCSYPKLYYSKSGQQSVLCWAKNWVDTGA